MRIHRQWGEQGMGGGAASRPSQPRAGGAATLSRLPSGPGSTLAGICQVYTWPAGASSSQSCCRLY